MIVDFTEQKVTFTRSTYDKHFKRGNVVSFIAGPPTQWDNAYILAQKGKHPFSLYKARRLKSGEILILHAFTATPFFLNDQKNFKILGFIN